MLIHFVHHLSTVCFHQQQCDASKSGYLSGKEIEHFYDLLTHREEIDMIYKAYAKTTSFMSAENLVEFLMKEQRQKVTLADAQRIIEKSEPDEMGQNFIWICTFELPMGGFPS